jgi:uncharacterized protein with FMN-binding domain
MRRTAAAVALTLVGLWLVLTFKSSPALRATAVSGTSTTTMPATSPSGAAAAAGPPGSGSTTTTAGSTGPRTVDGNTFTNRYGPVQVAVVLNGTRIVSVQALQMPTDRARSADISSQAAPLLSEEVLAAQSAQIDSIGGATYTSQSYAQSLQSALDKAHG